MKASSLFVLVVGLAIAQPPANAQENINLLTLDEDVWVTFYDVPSRRFRTIRDKFIQRDFESAARDLDTSIAFLTVEADRAVEALQPPLKEVIMGLTALRTAIATPDVTVLALDAAFARTHWLLAQHFFVRTLDSRKKGEDKNAGHYLWATAHHIERAVLWSNARIDRKTVNSLESMRGLANRLRTTDRPERVYQERPLRLAAQTIIAVGEHLERTVRIEKLVEEQSQP